MRQVRREDLEELAKDGKIRLVATGVKNRRSRWALGGARHPEQHEADTAVSPRPRVRASETRFCRVRSRNLVNGFLKHPVVDHKHGRVAKAKSMFVARRPDGELSAVATVNVPNARQACDRRTVEITRYASHPEDATMRDEYPNGTGTKMLSRICRWAALEGFEKVRALSGTAGNDGGIYRGAGFTDDGQADSGGDYNRPGRSNQNHGAALTRFIRKVDADGSDADPGVQRRVEARFDGVDGGGTTKQTGIATFGADYDGTATADDLALTREEVTDTKYARDNEYPNYSGRSKAFFETHGAENALENLRHEAQGRGRYSPAAVFGGDVDGELAVAIAVSGDATAPYSEATAVEFAACEVTYPASVARWVLVRVREWAALEGYDALTVPGDTFEHVDGVRSTLPKGVGFEATETGDYRVMF